jgi:hypothetical protein
MLFASSDPAVVSSSFSSTRDNVDRGAAIAGAVAAAPSAGLGNVLYPFCHCGRSGSTSREHVLTWITDCPPNLLTRVVPFSNGSCSEVVFSTCRH